MPQFRIVKSLARTTILDHYVVNKQKSNFLYKSMEDDQVTLAFGLSYRYVHDVLLDKYPDFSTELKAYVYKLYKYKIYKPLNEVR